MIKNEREYRITKAQVEKFQTALAEFLSGAEGVEPMHPLVRQAHEEALRAGGR
jgi:hypothetical protein